MSAEPIQVLQSQSSPPGPRSAAVSGAPNEATPRIPEELSILPVREFVVFPGTVLPLTVTRPASIKLLDETLSLPK
jgi:ATP-dependent Lon protease